MNSDPSHTASVGEREAWRLVRAVREPTPLEPSPHLVPGRELLLKREDVGPNRSFKWRGALCACEDLRRRGATGLVTASTGNHGAAVAWAAKRVGLRADVVVPRDSSERKCALIENNGGHLHRHGSTLGEASAHARELGERPGLKLFEDGASGAQLLGTGTIARELGDARLDAVIAPLGCGALAGGLAQVLKRSKQHPAVFGVQVRAYSRLADLFHGRDDPGSEGGSTFADGLADNRLVEPAYSACLAHLDDVLVVDDEQIAAALREIHARHGILVEGAAAAPLAAVLFEPARVSDGRLGLIVSGANLSPGLARRLLDGGPADPRVSSERGCGAVREPET